MSIERWKPRVDLTRQEESVCKHLKRVRTLLVFLRRHRHELFDAALQDELESMYRDSGAGRTPVAPALMAMATLVQDYLAVSDAEMVKLSALDLSVQMVLDRLGESEAAFSQGAFREFRQRLIRTDMDRRLLERTVEIAKQTQEFDWKKLPKTLRVGIDSAPLEGAGRVEDTFNLLAHAARKVVTCAAKLLRWKEERVCIDAGIPLLLEPSIKAALDLDWSDAQQKAEAIKTLTCQLDALQRWLEKRLPEEVRKPPLSGHVKTLAQIRNQDLEPDPDGGGLRIREGVAEDRRVSIADPEMRHGRKSKSKLINGYKQHIAADLDSELILSAALTPANRPEDEAAASLKADIDRQGLKISTLYFDRGYVKSPVVTEFLAAGGEVLCKPWASRNGDLFTKTAFRLDMRARTATCPSGLQTHRFTLGTILEFSADICDACPVRMLCTEAKLGTGRSISIAEDEPFQHRMRKLQRSSVGRAKLRKRVGVEHGLASVTRRQGRRARYHGVRKNLFALRRAATIHNLQVILRKAQSPLTKAA